MLRTVVFDAELHLVVSHIEARDELPELVEDAKLRFEEAADPRSINTSRARVSCGDSARRPPVEARFAAV
jgi:hypothetical protein